MTNTQEIMGFLEAALDEHSLETAIQMAMDCFDCSHQQVMEALKLLSEEQAK